MEASHEFSLYTPESLTTLPVLTPLGAWCLLAVDCALKVSVQPRACRCLRARRPAPPAGFARPARSVGPVV